MKLAHNNAFGSIAFVTMGCAKNEVDSADMAEKLAVSGYEISDDPETADVVIVNTCSFIQSATEESIDAVLEVAGLENVAEGRSHLIVSGCMPARYGDELPAELPEARAFVPCSKEDDIVQVVDEVLSTNRSSLNIAPVGAPASGSAHVNGASAYVKISDGCNRFCSYCAIPYIRGPYHSFTLEEIERNVSKRINEGAREIVLIAQDTGRWGDDFPEKSSLARLMSTLAEKHPDTWFRVMYIQPEGVTDELISAVAQHDNICSYFDLPFQHVNPDLLKAMNRRGGAQEYNQLIAHIRESIPDVTIRTTLIAGFPGETDEQFDELCEFAAEADIDYIGTFAYSREEGTGAYDLPNQIDEDEKVDRAQRLRDLADSVCIPRVAARIDSTMPVLICGREEDDQLYGRAMCQAPEVDGVTYLDNEAGEIGSIVTVKIDDALLYEMEGTILP